MHVFAWEGKSSTRLEECTRELQGIVLHLDHQYILISGMVPSNPLHYCFSSWVPLYLTFSSSSESERASLGNDEMAGQRLTDNILRLVRLHSPAGSCWRSLKLQNSSTWREERSWRASSCSFLDRSIPSQQSPQSFRMVREEERNLCCNVLYHQIFMLWTNVNE